MEPRLIDVAGINALFYVAGEALPRKADAHQVEGICVGVDLEGRLHLQQHSGELVTLPAGEISYL